MTTTESCETVLCKGRLHRILWTGIEHTLLDHLDEPALDFDFDIEAELVLAVLGGGRGCVGRLAIWRALDVEDIGAFAWRTSSTEGADLASVRAVVPDAVQRSDRLSRLQPTAMVEVR